MNPVVQSKMKYYDGTTNRFNRYSLFAESNHSMVLDRPQSSHDAMQTKINTNHEKTNNLDNLYSYNRIGCNESSMCRTKYDIADNDNHDGIDSHDGIVGITGGADNLQPTISQDTHESFNPNKTYVPHGCNVCPDKDVGNINVLNQLRTGEHARMEGYLYGEYVNDLFIDMETTNPIINTETLPFPRGGISTRNINRTSTNNL